MYGIPGLDDEETLQQIFGSVPLDNEPQPNVQAQQAQAPVLAQLLAPQQLEEMTADGSDIAQALRAEGEGQAASAAAAGRNRIAQQSAANQNAMAQDAQSRGGGLLSSLLKIGANIAMNKWISGMIPKRGA